MRWLADTDCTKNMEIRIENLDKCYGQFQALNNIDLTIASGELLALLGPSGSGKTTLLRLMAGLTEHENGRIHFGDINTAGMSLRERRVGLVFQNYALFPHLSVFENVAFGLRCRPRRERPNESEIVRRVSELLDRMQIPELRDRLPEQLSGGQKQRVSLVRAMAIEPRVLLLDEPFGALDAKVRIELRRWLRQIHNDTGYTTVFVTHDQEEALELADRVVVMNRGCIEQVGPPGVVYNEPATPFVFDFLGRSNQIEGRVVGNVFTPNGGGHAIAAVGIDDSDATLFARPHDFRIVTSGDGFNAEVATIRSLAGRTTIELVLPTQPRLVEVDIDGSNTTLPPAPGQRICVTPTRPRIFPRL